MKIHVTYKRFLKRQSDLRITCRTTRTPSIAAMIASTTDSSAAGVSALIPHSRMAYRISSAAKTRGSVIHPLSDIEHFQDRLRQPVAEGAQAKRPTLQGS